ncbi:MAG: MbnP family protein [Bacteroidia bacterium]
MKKLYLLVLLVLGLGTVGFAQRDVYLRINHQLGSAPFQLATQATNDLGNGFNVQRLQYYMGEITVIHDGGQTTLIPDTWILVDASQSTNVFLGNLPFTILEGVSFGIGVDSAHNHLDPSQYAVNHPLAPQSPSMHWGWSSGYRFVAMEGNSGVHLAQTYEIHALEDPNYFKQTINMGPYTASGDMIITLDADYVEALHGIDVSTGPIAHGGTGIDVTLLENFRDRVFTDGVLTGAASQMEDADYFTVAPNPSNGHLSLYTNAKISSKASFVLIDALGREVQSLSASASGRTEMDWTVPGCYWVSLRDGGRNLGVESVVITR